MRKPALLTVAIGFLAGCGPRRPGPRLTAEDGARVPPFPSFETASSSAAPTYRLFPARAGSPLMSPIDTASTATAGTATGVAASSAAAERPLDAVTAASQSGVPLNGNGEAVDGRRRAAGTRTAAARRAQPGGSSGSPNAETVGAQGPAESAAPAEAPAVGAAEEASPPPLSTSLNREEINKLLENRLDIGAYRVQIAATNDFSDANVLFDKTYDIMEDINLFDEFRGEGVRIDRNAYWVRITFIDLLQEELPWTQPRLYGLNKKRLDTP